MRKMIFRSDDHEKNIILDRMIMRKMILEWMIMKKYILRSYDHEKIDFKMN